MIYAGVIYLLQIALILHVLRTGRNMYWVFILIIAPGIGGLAYVIVELLPALQNDWRARRALRNVRSVLDPDADLRRHKKQHRLSGSVDATRHLAAELVASGRYAEAIEHYQGALKGLYEHDPDLMLGLATAQFGNEQFQDARQTLELLREKNPDYKSQEGHLLYARAIEACGDDQAALEEYQAIAGYFAGAEARLRYGQILERSGETDAARAQYQEIIDTAELAPRHYRKAQREWINLAKEGIKRTSGQ
ncbi:MAG: tetratricopeptide repeat protein [Woeseiaceae bacterium]|nr:tetratricopeptide repeat protein [Woeseiaceae bacterium]